MEGSPLCLRVLLPRLCASSQMMAEGEICYPKRTTMLYQSNVESGLPALTKIETAGNTCLAHVFIATADQCLPHGIQIMVYFPSYHDVDDGFGEQAGHGRASNMLDLGIYRQHGGKASLFCLKEERPLRIIGGKVNRFV